MKILMIAYDNDSFLTWFPQGLAYLASACRNAGHLVEIYQQDIYHWPDEHLTNKLDNEKYDIVLLSVIGGYYQYRKLLKLSEAINSSINRKYFKYLIGGHGPASDPEYFLRKTSADFVGIGEGEITIVELLEAIDKNEGYEEVNGIAFIKNNKYFKTEPRELIKAIDDISYPAWDLFNIDYYALMRMPRIKNTERSFPILSGRG